MLKGNGNSSCWQGKFLIFWVHLVPVLHHEYPRTFIGFTLEISKIEMPHKSNGMTHCLLGSAELGHPEDLKI